MKNKGFTLVELLAVIAILAILVIVAMPNVLGMFNQAKVSSFVTEVQKIMDTATTTFTKDALLNSGKAVYYSSTENATLGTKKLNMSGNEKNYFIEMDRNGEFKRVVVYDDNYCYDIYTNYGNSSLGVIQSERIVENLDNKFKSKKIEKTDIVFSDVFESLENNINAQIIKYNDIVAAYVVSGCENKSAIIDKVKINNLEFSYVAGMSWEQWVNSPYNLNDYYIASENRIYNKVCNDASCLNFNFRNLRYTSNIYYGSMRGSGGVDVLIKHHIIKNEDYFFFNIGELFSDSYVNVGEKYYDFSDNGGKVIYNQQLKDVPYDGFGYTTSDFEF